ncbi:MAG: phage/plasmid primase, P4 family [Jiangellaceae bacterium]
MSTDMEAEFARMTAAVDALDNGASAAEVEEIRTGLIPVPSVEEFTAAANEAGDPAAKRTYGRKVAKAVAANIIDQTELQEWRDRLKDVAGLPGRDFNEIVTDAKRAAKRSLRTGDPDREGVWDAPLLPEPGAPERVARTILATVPHTDGVPHRAWWRDEFYQHVGSHWDVLDKSVLLHWIYRETAKAAFLDEGLNGEMVRRWWNPTKVKVENVAHALGVGVVQRFGEPDECIAFTNGVLDNDLPSRKLLDHHPERFNLHSLPFEFDPDAECPTWLAFLAQVLPDEDEQDGVLFLQEWFGYVVSGRTDLHKIASLIGDKRCGKGTIARVLIGMVGAKFVSGPKLGQLAGQFGLEPLIGKRLAVMGDVRWNHKNVADAVEVLLAVSGVDHGTVHRKNRTAWEGTLGVRFLMMSNDEPRFNDASGAMASRMIHVAFRQSFYGREDPSLTEKLLSELAGILNWALVGLDRLNKNGKFTVPASSVEVDQNVQRVASPSSAFIDDRCIREQGAKVSLPELFKDYQEWCRKSGRPDDMASEDMFASQMRSATRSAEDGQPSVSSRRKQVNGERTTWFFNFRLRNALDGGKAPEPDDGEPDDSDRWLVSGAPR